LKLGRNTGKDKKMANTQHHSGQSTQRGFASMDDERQRDIARKGGQSSHGGQDRDESSRGNTSNRGFASMDDDRQHNIASKGGQSVPDEKRSFSQDRELASEAGRKGGNH
jgi:uncharacterized protein